MATVVADASSSLGIPVPSRPTYSCVRCVERKVRCDRQRPCSACVKHNVDCIFNLTQPPRKRQRRVRDQVLADRLRYYETLLLAQGIDPNKLPNTPESEPEPRQHSSPAAAQPTKESLPHAPSPTGSEPNEHIHKTQVVHGQGHFNFVDNSLWARVVEELHDPENALEDVLIDTSDRDESDDDYSFVLGKLPQYSLRSRHPPIALIYQLWQIFIDNVDPLTKIVHVPSLQLAIQKAAKNIEAVPRSFETLMFAIYGAAIVSLGDEECRERFHESRKVLLSRYISNTKIALSRVKFMGTTSLVVLQALLLHLISVRDIYELRAVWSLTGVAVRIAEGMGLNRDGDSLGLPPFEAEMRRRVWWMLKTHDFRTAELCGLPKFRDIDTGPDSTKFPTNVSEDQLHPGMATMATESNVLTDFVFVALRYELTKFAASQVGEFRKQGKGPSQWDLHSTASNKFGIDDISSGLEELFETKYLRYCDPSQPLQLLSMLIARFSVNIVRFLGHHPRRWANIESTPITERQRVWEISVKLLEQYNMLLSNPQLKQFAWHTPYFQQWHAFIHVLDTLKSDPLVADARKAWQLVGSIYENIPGMIFDMRKPIHIAVGNLCLKAYSRGVAISPNVNTKTPKFILQLQAQLELVKARRRVRETNDSQSQNLVALDQDNTLNTNPSTGAGIIGLSDVLESTTLQHSTIPLQSRSVTEDDSFWLLSGFGDTGVNDLGDAINMDLDFMLAEDHSMEDEHTHSISWEQWDTWLADSNLLLPDTTTYDFRPET